MYCRRGSSCKRDISASSSTTSRDLRLLPMMTASASAANSNGCCALTTTPFMDVTISDGLAISARHPGSSTRLTMCAATNESISLNASKVTTATLMPGPRNNQSSAHNPTTQMDVPQITPITQIVEQNRCNLWID